MIQAYIRGNEEFEKNGDMVLFPESCTLNTTMNGTWVMELTHPIDPGGRWKFIEEEGVISAPTFVSEKQLFRIDRIQKSDTEIILTAYPIFFDSADDCYLVDTRPTDKNGQQALDIMMQGSKYKGRSNIRKTATSYFVRKNLMEAINGEDENSFISRWGGEILFDNYTVTINERIGGDHGIEIRYGKNMDGISYDLNMAEVATRIVPVAYNGHTIAGNTPWVDSPLIDRYAKIYTRTIKFDDVKMKEDAQEAEEGVTVCNTQAELKAALSEKCREQYAAGIDKPGISIKIGMTDLSHTEEYSDYKVLETVSLGDTVHCYHELLDVETSARVIEITWDCCNNRAENIELGDFTYNYLKEISSVIDRVDKAIRHDGSVVAEEVKGIINAINASLQLQSTAAKKVDGRAFLIEDLDPASGMFGAMEAGTQGLRISKERNPDNREWLWTTAITALGIIADTIVTGRLTDKTGESYWDMDTGEMVLSGIFRQFNRKDGYKSIDIMNNRINIYSWQKEGNYVGSIGSLAKKTDPDSRQTLGIYSDTMDRVGIGYISNRLEDGTEEVTYLVTFDGTKLGKESYSDRAVKFREIPEIPGTITLPVTIGTTTLHFFNGLCIGRDYGQTFYGEFKTGADETVKVSNGVIKDIV